MVNDNALVIKNISVCFDGFLCTYRCQCKCKKKQYSFFIGPNGAGKTTLLDIICAKTRPTQGSVIFIRKTVTAWKLHKMKEYKIVHAGCRKKISGSHQFL